MNGEERRDRIVAILEKSKSPVPGTELARQLEVSRQVIVQDIALLRARHLDIFSTNRGYVFTRPQECVRILKVIHTEQDVERELHIIVDNGGRVRDVFVYHKVYGVVKAELNLHSRRDITAYMEELSQGKSTPLMNVTAGYHYHTIVADDETTLDLIQEELDKAGFLASLKEYEPVDFWKKQG